jgi:hypothetical protein
LRKKSKLATKLGLENPSTIRSFSKQKYFIKELQVFSQPSLDCNCFWIPFHSSLGLHDSKMNTALYGLNWIKRGPFGFEFMDTPFLACIVPSPKRRVETACKFSTMAISMAHAAKYTVN